MVARIVKQQNVFARHHLTTQNVPGGGDQFVTALQHLGMRHAAGGDDDHVRVFGQHRGFVGQGVKAKLHAAFFATRHAPVDDADHLAPARADRRQANLAAGLGRGFEHRYRVPALGTDTRGLQARRPCANDEHFALGRRWRNRVWQRQFAPGGRVVDAIGLAPGVNAVQAKITAYTRAYGVFTPFQDFAHDVGVGHVGARHAHHVQFAAGDRMARGVHILNLGGVEDGYADVVAQTGGKVQVRRTGHALHRNHVGQARIGIDMAADDVQKIHHPGVRQIARNAYAFFGTDTARAQLVGHATHAHNKVRPHALTNRAHHFHGKAHPDFQYPAKRRVQCVGRGRPELVDQMPVGLQFQAIDPCGVHAFGGVGVVTDDAVDIPVFHLFGEGAVRGLARV